MISIELARALRDSGLPWHPVAGDAFRIDSIEAEDDVFILSDMTVEAHDFPTGTVLGFNGTTEWALDSVDKSDALWMPHEHQLRTLLGAAFVALRARDEHWAVDALIDGEPLTVEADTAADAYARALLRRLDTLAADETPADETPADATPADDTVAAETAPADNTVAAEAAPADPATEECPADPATETAPDGDDPTTEATPADPA